MMRSRGVVFGAVVILAIVALWRVAAVEGSGVVVPDDCDNELTTMQLEELAGMFNGIDDNPQSNQGADYATCLDMMSDEVFEEFYPLWGNEEGFDTSDQPPLEDVDETYDPITEPGSARARRARSSSISVWRVMVAAEDCDRSPTAGVRLFTTI